MVRLVLFIIGGSPDYNPIQKTLQLPEKKTWEQVIRDKQLNDNQKRITTSSESEDATRP